MASEPHERRYYWTTIKGKGEDRERHGLEPVEYPAAEVRSFWAVRLIEK
jgi:hypothetical protein